MSNYIVRQAIWPFLAPLMVLPAGILMTFCCRKHMLGHTCHKIMTVLYDTVLRNILDNNYVISSITVLSSDVTRLT